MNRTKDPDRQKRLAEIERKILDPRSEIGVDGLLVREFVVFFVSLTGIYIYIYIWPLHGIFLNTIFNFS